MPEELEKVSKMIWYKWGLEEGAYGVTGRGDVICRLVYDAALGSVDERLVKQC